MRTLANRTVDVTEEIDRVMTLINQHTQTAVRDSPINLLISTMLSTLLA
ncbi:hypothetical protein [Pseudomonas sp. GD03696]